MTASAEISSLSKPHPIHLANGKALSFDTPLVMGIVNITPDSFYDGGRFFSTAAAVAHAEKLLNQGADIIDLGACSTRPNAAEISEEEEMRRLFPVLETFVKRHPEAVISIDTYRAKVAMEAIAGGANIINDISGGTADEEMFDTVSKLQVPYILMHIQGTPQTMQTLPEYVNVVKEIEHFFEMQIVKLQKAGIKDIIIDPGFGFGKTTEHNFSLLKNLDAFTKFHLPLLAGISRKSMINKILNVNPSDALTGTIALNTVAVLKGANIIRVHDVAEAKQVIKLATHLMKIDRNMDIRK